MPQKVELRIPCVRANKNIASEIDGLTTRKIIEYGRKNKIDEIISRAERIRAWTSPDSGNNRDETKIFDLWRRGKGQRQIAQQLTSVGFPIYYNGGPIDIVPRVEVIRGKFLIKNVSNWEVIKYITPLQSEDFIFGYLNSYTSETKITEEMIAHVKDIINFHGEEVKKVKELKGICDEVIESLENNIGSRLIV